MTMGCPHHSNTPLMEKQHKETYLCKGCNMDGKGKGYVCPSNNCDYILHSQCNFPSNKITPPSLENCEFIFMKKPPESCRHKTYDNTNRYCDACGMAATGFVYHCNNMGLELDLHPCCVSLESLLEFDQEFFFLKKSKLDCCDLCKGGGSSSSSSSSVGHNIASFGWHYATKDESCKCHVYCIMNIGLATSTQGKDLVKLESLPLVRKKRKKKKNKKKNKKNKKKKGGDIYFKALKLVINLVITLVFGCPTFDVGSPF